MWGYVANGRASSGRWVTMRQRVVAVLAWTAAWIRIALWVGLFHMAHAPWSELGGLIDEWWRWLERVVALGSCLCGHTVGGLLRDRRETGRPVSGRALRTGLSVPAAIVAVLLVVLRVAGHETAVGIALVGLLGYGTGFAAGTATEIVVRVAARLTARAGARSGSRSSRRIPSA